MFTKTLYPAEVMASDVAGVRLRIPRQEGPYPGVQRNDADLGLASTPLRLHRDRQVILPVVQRHPTVLRYVGDGFGHPEVAQDGVINPVAAHRRRRYETSLAGILPAPEFHDPKGFVQALAGFLCRRQLFVGLLAPADRQAGVTHRNAPDLVGRGLQPLRRGVNDLRLDRLPISDAPRFPQPRHRLVVAPSGGVKPQFQRPALLRRRIGPYPPGSRLGSGGVRAVGN